MGRGGEGRSRSEERERRGDERRGEERRGEERRGGVGPPQEQSTRVIYMYIRGGRERRRESQHLFRNICNVSILAQRFPRYIEPLAARDHWCFLRVRHQ
jgi:hypothetical protein